MLSASFVVLSQNTGFYPSLDRIIETTLCPLNLGPRGGSYNEPISRLHRLGHQLPKAAPIFHCGKPCNRLANYSIPWPMGREILLSGQDSDLSSLGAYEGSALRGG